MFIPLPALDIIRRGRNIGWDNLHVLKRRPIRSPAAAMASPSTWPTGPPSLSAASWAHSWALLGDPRDPSPPGE